MNINPEREDPRATLACLTGSLNDKIELSHLFTKKQVNETFLWIWNQNNKFIFTDFEGSKYNSSTLILNLLKTGRLHSYFVKKIITESIDVTLFNQYFDELMIYLRDQYIQKHEELQIFALQIAIKNWESSRDINRTEKIMGKLLWDKIITKSNLKEVLNNIIRVMTFKQILNFLRCINRVPCFYPMYVGWSSDIWKVIEITVSEKIKNMTNEELFEESQYLRTQHERVFLDYFYELENLFTKERNYKASMVIGMRPLTL